MPPKDSGRSKGRAIKSEPPFLTHSEEQMPLQGIQRVQLDEAKLARAMLEFLHHYQQMPGMVPLSQQVKTQARISVGESRATSVMREFQRLQPPRFFRGTDPFAIDHLLRDVSRLLDTVHITEDDL
ncbi:hypothetical protein F0562_013321 [Nyssa sinensis]|uniref:Uncharacterized protein n=1 Tax=Nyssa sinensis TaxID=561372 RepID=A0A5J4ZKE8_9ASTE|nr:hypothetical protein F0562_013321 [Nyssa sinensis]